MPVFKIQTPSGRTVTIEAATRDAALAGAQEWETTRKRGVGETILNATQTFNRSIPGFDEIADGLQAGSDLITGKAKSFPEAWAGARARSKAGAEDFGARHPLATAGVNGLGMAAQIAPALVTGGASSAPAAAPVAKGLFGAAARAFNSQPVKSALAGGIGGFVGAASGEGDAGERLSAGNQAVVPGAAIGAVLPGVAKVAGDIVNAVGARRATPALRTAARAGRILAGRVPQIEQTISGVADDIRLPFERMGRGGKGLTRALANVPGPGQEMIEGALTRRQAQAPRRMLSSASRELGDDGAGFYDSMDALDRARKSAAAPLYDEAYSAPPTDVPHIEPLLNRPSTRGAMSRAARIAEEEGRDPAELGLRTSFGPGAPRTRYETQAVTERGTLGEPVEVRRQVPITEEVAPESVFSRQPTMQTLDYVKRGLDDVLETYRDKTTGKLVLDEEGRAVLGTLNQLRSQLTEMNPKYGEALAAYAGPTKQMQALRRGREIVTGRHDAEMIDDMTGRMSADEATAQRLGMARGLADKFRSGNPQKAFREIANSPVMQDRMRAGFGNDDAFSRFLRDVEGEAGAQKSFNEILSGSRTTPLVEDIRSATVGAEEMGIGDHLAQIGARRVGGQSFRTQAANAAIGAYERIRQPGIYDPEVNRTLAEVMVGRQSPQHLLSAMDEIQAVRPMRNVTPKAAAAGVIAGEGDQPRRSVTIELEDGSGIDEYGRYIPPRR